MVYNVIMPKLAETMEEGTIARWCKREGEWVDKGEPLLEVEMEKTTMEVPSPASGYLRRVLFQEGDAIPVTRVIAYIAENMDEEVPIGAPAEPAMTPFPEVEGSEHSKAIGSEISPAEQDRGPSDTGPAIGRREAAAQLPLALDAADGRADGAGRAGREG